MSPTPGSTNPLPSPDPGQHGGPDTVLAVLLHVDLQDVVGFMQQQQGLETDGVRVAQPLPQRAQAPLRHLPQLLGAPVQLLQEPQALSAPGVRGLWGAHPHGEGGRELTEAPGSPEDQRHPTAPELLQPGSCIPGDLGQDGESIRPLELSRGAAGSS